MRDILTVLEQKYPKLFEKYRAGGNEIDVSSGWYDLIDKLSDEVSRLCPEARVIQIKEKFGELRYYTKDNHPEIYLIIDVYRELASKTCEICGKEGRRQKYTPTWVRTVCDECVSKQNP